MSLVPDYGVTSSESSSDSETDSDTQIASEENPQRDVSANTAKLPTPGFICSNNVEEVLTTSVFKNPFIEAENAKQAVLERHVKMVKANDKSEFLNGKKICWNYRKGRCRFGHNCKYAHDSDLQKSKEQLQAERQVEETVLCQSQPLAQPTVHKIDEIIEESVAQKRKRPGLSQGIVPGKKVMKNYFSQKK